MYKSTGTKYTLHKRDITSSLRLKMDFAHRKRTLFLHFKKQTNCDVLYKSSTVLTFISLLSSVT